MFDKIGGRKLAMSMIALLAGIIIDLNTERGLSEPLLYLLLGIIGTFSATNVASKAATRGQNVTKDPEVEEKINQLEQHAAGLHNVVDDLGKQVESANKRTLAILENMGGN